MRKFEFVGLSVLFGLCLGATFLAGYYTRAFSGVYPGLHWALPGLPSEAAYPLLAETRGLVENNYIGALPAAPLLDRGAARGFVAAVGDPYTVFVDPPAAELESNSLQGEYGGVGVTLNQNAAGEIVLDPILDSPAMAAGVLTGDILLRVDDQVISTTTTLDAVTALVRGPLGSQVTLTVRRAGQILEFQITRQPIQLPSVTGHLVAGQPAIGLIALSRFSDRTAAELDHTAQTLTAQGARKFILDLRGNGGGLLDAAVAVAGRFLDGGPVLIETSRTGVEKNYAATPVAGPLLSAPLAVLVNGNTASASEILAGALLDRDRAPLIGQTTFGKGSVQYVFPLSDGSSLHVTANLWFTPTRRKLDHAGLPPTYAVAPGTDGADPEVDRAVQYLTQP